MVSHKAVFGNPRFIDFGRQFLGSSLYFSFHVSPANELRELQFRPLQDSCDSQAVCKWLELRGPICVRPSKLYFFGQIHAVEAGDYATDIIIECDMGVAKVSLAIRLCDPPPNVQDVVISPTPFDANATDEEISAFIRTESALSIRLHVPSRISEIAACSPSTVILWDAALVHATNAEMEKAMRVAEAGSTIVFLADTFVHGTTSRANDVLAELGIYYDAEAGVRRLTCAAPVIANERDIHSHALTTGVKRLRFSSGTCCPIRVQAPATPVVGFPGLDAHALIAEAKRQRGAVVAVSTSSLAFLGATGWPFDNSRLMANLLVGGDATSALAL
jgi:hypothetical protein